MPKRELFSNILYWVLVAIIAIVIVQIIRKIAGGSWTTEAVIIALVLANLGYSFYIGNILSKHIGEHKGYERGLHNGLDKKDKN